MPPERVRIGLIADVQRAEVLFAMPDVHLVYIATPPFLHYEQARAALREGKHVIVEKPLAVTMEQADEIVVSRARHAASPRHELDAALQPTLLSDQGARRLEASWRRAARHIRELCVRRRARSGPLVLGPHQERRDLHRARRAFLRHVRGLARRWDRRIGGTRAAPRIGDRGTGLLHRSVRRRACDVLPWLYASGPHGPSGAAPPLRAWRRDAARMDPDAGRRAHGSG